MKAAVTYEYLTELLKKAHAPLGAAEIHGLQTGLICGGHNAYSIEWNALLARELDCGMELFLQILEQMEQLYVISLKELQSIAFNFQLLLPHEYTKINLRAVALAEWCRGFLCGLGLSGVTLNYFRSALTKEALKDLSLIAQVETKADGEELSFQETAYSELLEYVKIVVHGIHLELQNNKNLVNLTPQVTVH